MEAELAAKVARTLRRLDWHEITGEEGTDPDPEAVQSWAAGYDLPHRTAMFQFTRYADDTLGLVSFMSDRTGEPWRQIPAPQEVLSELHQHILGGDGC